MWSVAACVMLLAMGAGVLLYPRLTAPHYETRIGEQRDVLLSDGSRVTLNTNTALSVHYSKGRRFLVLERGEALFSVAHNTARPFDVAAAGTLTRAVGTEFNVDMRNTKVTVSVLEGVVQVSTATDVAGARQNASEPTVAPLQAESLFRGQALEFHPGERLVVQHSADIGRIDSWEVNIQLKAIRVFVDVHRGNPVRSR